jgi:hypothetical protein
MAASPALIQQRNLWAAEMSLRDLGSVSLEDALGYLDLLAEVKPEKIERAAVALAALGSLCAGEREAVQSLRRLLRRVRPGLLPPIA